MRYFLLLIAILPMIFLCSCSPAEEFTPPGYNVVEKPDEATAASIDGYRIINENDSNTDTTAVIYYANRKSKKFHIPDCTYAKKMNETTVLIEKDKNILISNGYTPCSFCKP